MDINALNLIEAEGNSAKVELLHPGTGVPLGITLDVLGFESEVVADAVDAYHSSVMNRKKKSSPSVILEERRRVQAKASVVGVHGGSGQMATVEGVQAYISDPGFVWLIEQIEAVAGDRASFFENAETS